MFVKNNLVNRGYCLFQSCLNRFSLPCGRFSPKHEILHFPPRKANAKTPPRKTNAKLLLRKADAKVPPHKANAKLPPRTLRKSKPESPMSLKASPKPNIPYKISALKSPLAASFAATVGTGTPLSSGDPDPRPLLPLAQDPEAPLHPIRSKPLCTRAAAQPNPARPGGRFVRSVALDVAARAAAGNPHVCVICPVAVIHSLAISIRWGNPPIVKTKISASLQLFCDCELFPVPAKQKRSLHTANYLHFCASIRNWEARNNCQSQKSCNLSRFFVSGLLE